MANPSTVIRTEFDTMTELLALLEQEQQFLVDANTGALEQATPAKMALVARMAAASGQRQQAQAAAGFPASDAAMEQWLEACGDGAATALWQSLLDLTRAAQELNRVNGMLIARHLANNQTLLNAMRQPAAAGGDAGVYGPSGQTQPGGPSRRFVVG